MDKSLVKKVETFKSGIFVFSLKYDREKIKGCLNEINLLYDTIVGVPILPDISSQIEDELIRSCIFSTAAIEGNPLSQEKVDNILLKKRHKGFKEKKEKQIQNLKYAYKIIKKAKPADKSPFLFTDEEVRKFHEIITKESEDSENSPGRYRNFKVLVGDKAHGGVYTPPKILPDIEKLMSGFVKWINSDMLLKEAPIVRAALSHYYLGLIHPFGDGNGRTARAIEALMLKKAGLKYVPSMLSNYYYKNMDEYYWAFSLSRKSKEKDITAFLDFFMKGMLSSLSELRERIYNWIRHFMLKEYYEVLRDMKKINQRQYGLMIFLLRYNEIFTLRDLVYDDKYAFLYIETSARTARRDIEHLRKLKLIKKVGKNRYQFNSEVLG